MTVMPKQKPGKSKQDYETPVELISFCNDFFFPLEVDLAAREDNKKCANCYTPEMNSLIQSWADEYKTGWLNPPFERIVLWVQKCMEEGQKGMNILLNVPAAIGSRWYLEYVYPYATTYSLYPRLPYDGWARTAYPKDCIIAHFGPGAQPTKLLPLEWISPDEAKLLRQQAKEKEAIKALKKHQDLTLKKISEMLDKDLIKVSAKSLAKIAEKEGIECTM